MRDDDQDGDDGEHPTREAIIEKYGWKPGEREEWAARMAARAAQIAAEQRAEALEAVVTKSAPTSAPSTTTTVSRASPAPASLTAAWQRYIDERIQRSERAMLKAFAHELVRLEREMREEHQAAQLEQRRRAEVRELRDRVEHLERGENTAAPVERSLKVVG